MRVAAVRPEKQQSIKFGFNVSKLGFAFWKNSKYTSTYLRDETNISAQATKNAVRLNWRGNYFSGKKPSNYSVEKKNPQIIHKHISTNKAG